MTVPHLHIYGPAYWHCDADIVGDEAALRDLRAAIDIALSRGYDETGDLFVTDGEGYRVRVLVAEELHDEPFPMPYWDDCAKDYHKDRWAHLEAAMKAGKEQAQ